MSWLDKSENNKFSIETGDGKVYFPLWKGGEKSKEFNTSIFDYINVEGSFVDRKKAKSSVFPLVFWFQGVDNIEQSNSFEASASDSRAWKVNHPLYGTITGQPLNLKRNDSNFNVTEVSVDFWETITDQFPKRKVSAIDSLKMKGSDYNKISGLVYASKITPTPVIQNDSLNGIKAINLKYDEILNDVNYPEYQSLLTTSLQSVDSMLTDPAKAIQDINTLINFPENFVASLQQRYDLMVSVYEDILQTLGINPNANDKAYFEATAGAVISTISNIITTPQEGDYVVRSDIENITSNFLQLYNNYLTTLDAAVIPLENTNNTFTISYESQVVLNSMVIESISNLFEIAFNSKQERIVQVEKDTNLILLTHKYMGLDIDDLNIEKFRQINKIKNRELSIIKKGRTIKYYV